MYVDTAATTNMSKEELEELVNRYCNKGWYNPSSSYAENIRNEIENVREKISDYIDCNPNEIYFNSGSSEGNSTVIQGFVKQSIADGFHPVVITTPLEHASILKCVEDFVEDIHFVKIQKDGKINFKSLENLLKYTKNDNNKVLVSIQFVNNELGVVQDIEKISNIVHDYGALLHTDATQAFGKFLCSQHKYGYDFLTASGHKVHGLKGIGFMYMKNGMKIKPIIYGEQERGLRGGTYNTLGILSLSFCNAIIPTDIEIKKMYFVKQLQENEINFSVNCYDKKTMSENYAKGTPTSIVSITFNGVNAEALMYSLETDNVFVSLGSACSAPDEKISETLKAIGLNESEIKQTIRFSFPDDISFTEIDILVDKIKKHINVIKKG